MPNSDPWGRFVYPYLTLMSDSYILTTSLLNISDGKSMWTVPRKYTEFYVLEQKLTEFHGNQNESLHD